MNGTVEGSGASDPAEAGPGLDALRQSAAFRGPVAPVDDHDHSTDHLALIFEDEAERFETVVPYVREGLERGERVVYMAAENAREDVLAALREAGVPVDDAVESGSLVVESVRDTYLEGGSFDLEESLSMLAAAVDEAAEEHEGVRFTAEESWLLQDERARVEFMELESRVNDLLCDRASMALCQYDRTEFPDEVLEDVIRTHPHLLVDGTISQNVYYAPPDTDPAREETTSRVDRMLQTLHERTEAKTQLQDHERYLRALHEITADADRSFDEKVEALLDLGRERFDLDLGFFLEQEGDQFRVVKACGADFEEGVATLCAEPDHYCKHTITVDEPVGVEDTEAVGWDDDPLYRQYDLGCYLGTKVTDGADVFGSVCFADTAARQREFTDAEYTFLDLLGQWLSQALEREQREAALEQSKAQLERVVESSHDAILILDPREDEVLEANPAGCEMLGYDREELLALGCSDVFPGEEERFREYVAATDGDGTGWTDELACRRSDGRPVSAELSASRLAYDDRQCVVAIVRDISDRKRRERSHRRLYEIAADPDSAFEEKVQAVLELGCERFDMDHGGIASVDPEADRLEVRYASDDSEYLVPGEVYPLSQTYCREPTEVHQTRAVVDPVERGYEDKVCYEQFGFRAYLGTYLQFEDADGLTFFFVAEEPRDEAFSEAERTFLHLMGQWVKYELERQRYERDLESTVEQLRKSNDRLQQFAYAASHDLQEPLRMVSSYLQLLDRQCADELGEEAREYIDFAVEGADRMREMVDDLLAYSRVEQSEQSLEAVDCEAILEEVRDDLQVQIDENDAEVAVDSLPTVTADREQLKQLFSNLVSNGIKYNESETPRVDVHVERRPGHWEFAVSDNGIGIDSDDRDRIFEVFKRLHHDDEYTGTGVGLSLCQEIVATHDGDIWVDSEPGEGSTFRFTLPRRSED